jgi:hypothetical protein
LLPELERKPSDLDLVVKYLVRIVPKPLDDLQIRAIIFLSLFSYQWYRDEEGKRRMTVRDPEFFISDRNLCEDI